MTYPSYNNSLPQRPARNQELNIENRNFLSPVGFQFKIAQMPAAEFFCQAASIPAISMGTANQTTSVNTIYHPGDELYYEPLFIKFLIDENMKNYYQVHDWIRKITTPYSPQEFTFNDSQNKNDLRPFEPRDKLGLGVWENQWKSDCSLIVLSSNYRPVAEFVFKGAFPISLTTVNFDASVPDIQYFVAECTIRYDYFDYFIYEAAQATDKFMKPNYRNTELGEQIPGIS